MKTTRGIDKVIALAALDVVFKSKLLTNREAAIESCNIKLSDSERNILISIPKDQLSNAIDKTHVSNEARRKFLAGAVKVAIRLVIVGGVLGFLASISIGTRPEEGQELATISCLRFVLSGQREYKQQNNTFASTIRDLVAAGCVPDSSAWNGGKYGYAFTLSNVTENSFELRAVPQKKNRRFFFLDQTGIIRYSEGPEVGPESKELGR